MAEVGVFTLESLTTGMYENSLATFREYIQNSCEAIDDAVNAGILSAGDELITIDIDAAARRIIIEDNGTGISVLDFKSTLSNIGYSDKTLQTDRGFRGIGRLCGLAYCRELRFISTAQGENIQSTIIFDAAKLRAISHGEKKYTVKEALDEIVSCETVATDTDEHFFRVELLDIVDTNRELLDVKAVREYLAFVAPVDYKYSLGFKGLQNKISEHAAKLNFKIDIYNILVNGEHLYKPYKSNYKTTHNGADEIFDVEFRDFYDGDKLIAWSWVGLSEIKGVLDQKSGTADNLMRGIRLRAGNIQIGGADVFKNLFSETRGTNYFIGEVHTVDKNLRPNSRRDYFEEDAACNVLEEKLSDYFAELYKIYHTASDVRGAYKAINAPSEAENAFNKQSEPYKKSHRAEYETTLAKLNKTAQDKSRLIDKIRKEAEQNPDTPLSRVVLRMTENLTVVQPPPSQLRQQQR